MTLREALTSALAGPLVNARATIGGRRALRADAGQEQDRLRQQPAGLADRARMGRADDRADARKASLTDEVLADSCTRRATCCQSGRPSESTRSWTSAPPAFEVLTRQKMPAPLRRQAARNGSSESRPRYGFTVSASATGGRSPRGSRYAEA